MPNQWTAEQDRRLLLEIVNSFNSAISQKLWDQIGPVLGVTPKACKIKKAATSNEKTPVTPKFTKKTTSDHGKRPATPVQRTPPPRKRQSVSYAESDAAEPLNIADSLQEKAELESTTNQEWRMIKDEEYEKYY